MVIPKLETAIWQALTDAAHAVVTSPVMTVYEPGAIITGQPPYILLSDIRNDKVREGINASVGHQQSGTLLLTVHWPLSQPITHLQLVEIGATIAGNFTADKCLRHGQANLRVTRDSDVLASFVSGNFRVLPVRVFWVLT